MRVVNERKDRDVRRSLEANRRSTSELQHNSKLSNSLFPSGDSCTNGMVLRSTNDASMTRDDELDDAGVALAELKGVQSAVGMPAHDDP